MKYEEPTRKFIFIQIAHKGAAYLTMTFSP